MKATVTCSKCGKVYTGTTIKQIVKENNLLKAGLFYHCDGCMNMAERIKMKVKSNNIEQKKKYLSREISNDKKGDE